MHRLTYTTPLLLSMLVLAACPGDDVPADTEASTGDTTDATTAPTTTPLTTTTDPSTTDPDSTGEPVCEMECAPDECCIGNNCFSQPEPTCPGGCGDFEACLCPEGSDPCDCVGECTVCGVESPGSVPSCLDMDCPAGSFCVQDDPAKPTLAFCAEQGCGTDDCACPLPTDGATATPACGAFDGDDGGGSCFLDCSANGATCPDAMICRTVGDESACVWPGEGLLSSCCTSNPGTTGCDDQDCEDAVCGADPYCCDTEFDQICADAVPGLCPGLCPGVDPEPQYGDCINGGPCDAGLVCISDMGGTFGWCATLDCLDDMACQPPPGTGDAPAVCGAINDMTDACLLDCSMDQTCPDGMGCIFNQFCVWGDIPAPPDNYGDCFNNPGSCAPGEDACLDDGGMPPGAGACSQSDCLDAMGCPDAPATGTSVVSCEDINGDMVNDCYLDCSMGETCPDGMDCTNVGMGMMTMACMWPETVVLFEEDFEGGVLPLGWTVVDVDGNTPDGNVAFVNDAFVVSDEFEPGANFGAYSTSWYNPAGVSDDWLVSPQITLPATSTLSWDGWAPDPMFADGYEVWVSTTGPTVPELLAGTQVFMIADEADPYAGHMVDLAAAGLMNQDVYIGWRNNSNDEFILVIDNVLVAE